jgi:hypothetical protein
VAVRLSALRADRRPGKFVDPKTTAVAGMIRSIDKFNDLIGNRTGDLPACGILPQPSAQQRRKVRTEYDGLGQGPVAGCCDHGNEPSGYANCRTLTEQHWTEGPGI